VLHSVQTVNKSSGELGSPTFADSTSPYCSKQLRHLRLWCLHMERMLNVELQCVNCWKT